MGTERQVVKVEVDGLPQAKAGVQSLDKDVQKLSRDAQQAEADVNRAKAGGSSLMDRLRSGALLTRGGLKFGPVKIGKGGVGIDNINSFGLAARGALPLVAVHVINGMANNVSDFWDEADDKGFWKALGDGAFNSGAGVSKRVLDLGVPLTKLAYRAFGVRGDVFDEAYRQLTEPLESEEVKAAKRAERRQREREARLREQEEEEREKKRAQALQDATKQADEQFAKSQAGLESKRPVGFMFRHRSDFERYRNELVKKNRYYDELVREEQKKQAQKKIHGAGG